MSTLHLIATPIGNLEDITYRAVRVIGESGALACEDTRHTRIILDRYGITQPAIILSYHDHNEENAGRRILDLLSSGTNVALCTNAGTPGVSDPGFRIVAAAIEAGHTIDVIPGPSAVIHALVVSGLPVSSFTFKGFPPRKDGQLRRFLEMDKELPHTLLFYESPFRVKVLLATALEVMGDRKAAVCIELTKKFERIHRGWLSDLAREFQTWNPRGELTVAIAGNNPKFTREGMRSPASEDSALPDDDGHDTSDQGS